MAINAQSITFIVVVFFVGFYAGVLLMKLAKEKQTICRADFISSICSYLEEKYEKPKLFSIGYDIFGHKFNEIYKEYLTYGWNK